MDKHNESLFSFFFFFLFSFLFIITHCLALSHFFFLSLFLSTILMIMMMTPLRFSMLHILIYIIDGLDGRDPDRGTTMDFSANILPKEYVTPVL